MAGKVYAIRADVKITAPFNDPFTPDGENFLSAYDNTGAQTAFGHDILSVEVTNSLREPSGRFQIEMTPRQILGGKPWVEVIKPYSLVSITFQRMGDSNDPSTDPSPVPMMLGIIDSVKRADDYGDAAPNRSQRIMGRALTGVLEDHQYWFHHLLAQEGFAPADYREFLPAGGGNVDFRDEAAIRSLGLFAVKTDLFFLSERRPPAIIDAGFDFFVRGRGDKPPFIKIFFSDGKALRDRLTYDAAKTAETYFDKRASLPRSMVISELGESNLFDVLGASSGGPPYVEVFSETVGTSHADARVELVVRKPPFAGHVQYGDDGRISLGFATDDGTQPRMYGQSLFDETYGAWNVRGETVQIGDEDVVSTGEMSRSLSAGDIYTLYFVAPREEASRSGGHLTWKRVIPPIVEENPESPSYIKKLGLRPFTYHSPTIETTSGESKKALPSGDIARRCLAYATLAREWFYRGPEFWRGSYLLKGRTDLRVGKRLVDRNLSREYYISGVAHRMNFGDQPQYLTNVGVERGWDLNPGAM